MRRKVAQQLGLVTAPTDHVRARELAMMSAVLDVRRQVFDGPRDARRRAGDAGPGRTRHVAARRHAHVEPARLPRGGRAADPGSGRAIRRRRLLAPRVEGAGRQRGVLRVPGRGPHRDRGFERRRPGYGLQRAGPGAGELPLRGHRPSAPPQARAGHHGVLRTRPRGKRAAASWTEWHRSRWLSLHRFRQDRDRLRACRAAAAVESSLELSDRRGPLRRALEAVVPGARALPERR